MEDPISEMDKPLKNIKKNIKTENTNEFELSNVPF